MTAKEFNLDGVRHTFFIETREMLDEIERRLLELEKDPAAEECINALFRSVHTIKGSSGMFGYHEIEKFSHKIENILDQLRKGNISYNSELSGILFDCHDHIQDLLGIIEEDGEKEIPPDLRERMNALEGKLDEHLSQEKNNGIEKESDAGPDSLNNNADSPLSPAINECWHISIRFGKDVFRNGFDPYSFISYLNEIGKIVQIMTVADDIPGDDKMDPESCYLGFEIDFKGNVKKEAIENVFDFIKDECELRILPPRSDIEKYIDLINDLPGSSAQIGEMLVAVGSITRSELETALKLQKEKSESGEDADAEKTLLGDVLVEKNMIQKPVLDAALSRQQDLKKAEKRNMNIIRINAEKIDDLINLVGELVITGSNLKQISEKKKNEDSELVETISSLTRLIEEIRDSTMNIRMTPIGDTFKRFERTVRDLSREKGKEIDLVISGGDTELDKTLIDKISDSLMHIIRNAIDHGIDIPVEREHKGKPARGTISLNAYHEMGSVVIVASDDGEGIDRERIHSRAVELGFIQPGESITENELLQLIFEPGFSTAKEVTNISGRGVGMDIVKRNIEALRGSIAFESTQGVGTSIRIHLPLTLAIIDGFMVQVGEHFYVIPLDMVLECTDVSGDKLSANEGGNFINLRGELLPYMRLRDFFGENGNIPGKENIIVVEYAKKIAGLVVDKPVGEIQTVIKPLGRIFDPLRWISGATILGSGDVALILDVPRLIQKIEKSRSSHQTETGKEKLQ